MVIKMKIIISPAKTLKPDYNNYFTSKELIFGKEHRKVLASLRKLTKKDIKKVMKIDKELLNNTYQNIKNYSKNDSFQAFFSYDGLVYKSLEKDSYNHEHILYIENSIVILDAFYGVIEPGTLIKPYRLDMKMNIGLNLYKHWSIDKYFEDNIIINLASDEYSKMIKKDMINISFLQNKDGKYINQATYSKMARGLLLNYLINNQINEIDHIKKFNLDNYQYNKSLSDDSNIVFTR